MRVSRTIFGRRTSRLRWAPFLHWRIRTRYLARHAMAVPLSDGVILCRILGRAKLYVDAGDRGLSPHLLLDGYWEPRTTEVIVDRLRPNMVAVDVGANLGYFTVLMGLLTGPGGRVLAFEPNPDMVERLEGSLMINGLTEHVTIHPVPLGESDGREVNILIPDKFPGGARVTAASSEDGTFITARTRRLDTVPGALDAVLVKIDAEGMEEAIWQGMAAMIVGPALRYVVLEFCIDCYAAPGTMLDDAVAAGFRLHRIDDRRGSIPVTRDEVLGGPLLQMLLFER